MSDRPTCGKCGGIMTPENSMVHPEYFLHDECLPDELKPKSEIVSQQSERATLIAENSRLKGEVESVRRDARAHIASLNEAGKFMAYTAKSLNSHKDALKEAKALLENTKGNMFVHRPMLDWFDRRDALLATINKALGETGVK